MSNGIELILADHERVNRLFAEFNETHDGTLVGLIASALPVHDEAEQAALYPMAAQMLRKSALLKRFDLAHTVIEKLVDDVRAQEGNALIAAVARLEEAVGQHVRDEEENLLPDLDKKASPEQLETLGSRIEQSKQRVG